MINQGRTLQWRMVRVLHKLSGPSIGVWSKSFRNVLKVGSMTRPFPVICTVSPFGHSFSVKLNCSLVSCDHVGGRHMTIVPGRSREGRIPRVCSSLDTSPVFLTLCCHVLHANRQHSHMTMENGRMTLRYVFILTHRIHTIFKYII